MAISRILTLVLLTSLCLSISIPTTISSTNPDIDAYAEVVYVVDGDTIDVVVLKVFDTKYIGFLNKKIRIRFADINAPELYTYEGKLAKRFLYNLVYGRYVYLDIDDLYIYGKYGRVIAMVYLPINSTHLLNINLYLVEKGYAVFKDYPNQFNPYTWKLVVSLPLGTISITTSGATITSRSTRSLSRVSSIAITKLLTFTKTRSTTITITKKSTVAETVFYTKTLPSYRTITLEKTISMTYTCYIIKTIVEKPVFPDLISLALGIAIGLTLSLIFMSRRYRS